MKIGLPEAHKYRQNEDRIANRRERRRWFAPSVNAIADHPPGGALIAAAMPPATFAAQARTRSP
jgi:hypothetical protein